MAGETVITIIGNLTRDPELRSLNNGSVVANFTIAASERQYNRESQQWEDAGTLFLNCSAWDGAQRKLASNVAGSLAKGMRVIAQGRLAQRSYETEDHSRRTVIELRVDEIGPALGRATARVTRQQSGNAGGAYAGGQSVSSPAGDVSDPWGAPAAPGSTFGGAFGTGAGEPEF